MWTIVRGFARYGKWGLLLALLFAFGFESWAGSFQKGADPKKCPTLLKIQIAKSEKEAKADPFLEGASEYDDHLTLRRSPRDAGGTQGGEWFYSSITKKFYFGKSYGGNEERLLVEHLTNHIYRVFNVRVPNNLLKRINGKPYLLSEEVSGGLKSSAHELFNTDLAENFVVDAWLANWDVVGEMFDNVIVEGAKAYRVDNGGSLHFRATGEAKPFTNAVSELEAMRDPSRNSGQLFGRLSNLEVAGQIRRFLGIYSKNSDDIEELIRFSGLPATVRKRISNSLKARAEWLFSSALPRYHSEDSIAALENELKGALGISNWESDLAESKTAIRGKKDWSNLTDGELVAIKRYVGGDFEDMNGALRKGIGQYRWIDSGKRSRLKKEIYRPYNELMVRGLEKLPDFKGKVTRITDYGLGRYRIGETLTEDGFTSATDAGVSPFSGDIQIKIRSKRGKKVAVLNDDKRECEVIFLPGTRFKVTGKGRSESRYGPQWLIEMEEL